MKARLLEPQDVSALNEFLGGVKGDVDINRDIIVGVFEENNVGVERIVGISAARRIFYMHEFRLEEGNPMKRMIAEQLFAYSTGLGKAISSDQPNPEYMAKVPDDKEKMQDFHRGKGAVEETPGKLFTGRIR